MEEGFSFVGLTEAWALSICLCASPSRSILPLPTAPSPFAWSPTCHDRAIPPGRARRIDSSHHPRSFHLTFGGACTAIEFSNSRPGHYARSGVTPVGDGSGREAFAGYVDEYDWALYRAVEARFHRDVARRNASVERCEAICPSAPAGAFRGAVGEGSISRLASAEAEARN